MRGTAGRPACPVAARLLPPDRSPHSAGKVPVPGWAGRLRRVGNTASALVENPRPIPGAGVPGAAARPSRGPAQRHGGAIPGRTPTGRPHARTRQGAQDGRQPCPAHGWVPDRNGYARNEPAIGRAARRQRRGERRQACLLSNPQGEGLKYELISIRNRIHFGKPQESH